MKKTNKKLLIFLPILFSLPLVSFTIFYCVNNLNNSGSINLNNNDISFKNYSLETVTETKSTFSFLPTAEITWALTKKADEITAKDIQSILVPQYNDAIFHVEIKSIDKIQGKITFEIVQTIRTFVDGKVTSYKNEKIALTSSNPTSYDWTVPNDIILQDKYNFSWRDWNDISDFLSSTNLKVSELTPDIVINNLVLQDNIYKIPTNGVTISTSDVSTDSSVKYGVTKLTISFSNVQNNEWINDTAPTENQRTIILRGLNNSLGTKETMNFSTLLDGTSIKNVTFSSKTNFSNYLLDSEDNLVDLTPSEFVGVNNNNMQTLIDILQKGEGLNSNQKFINFSYMGKSLIDSDFQTTTGIDANIVSQIGLYNITSEVNDLTGYLKIVYLYRYYDVYTNSLIEANQVQEFPAGSFKTNPDANSALVFEWKLNSDITSLGSSYDIVNLFNKNQNDASLSVEQKKEYLIGYSNNFFLGSTDSYSKTDRTFSIGYVGGTKQENGNYVPVTTDANKMKQIEVTITFNSWNGNIYSETNNNVTTRKDGYKSTIVYDLPQYQFNNSSITWVPSVLSDLLAEEPSKISYDISVGIIDPGIFYTSNGLSNEQAIFFPNDNLGTLNVQVIGNANGTAVSYENTFTGFKKTIIGDQILQFGWLPQLSVPPSLIDKTVETITKQEIIDNFFANNQLFQSSIITENDINTIPDKKNNTIYVELTLDFVSTNNSLVNSPLSSGLFASKNKNFYTQIVGFSSTEINDLTKIPTPLNITLIASVSVASLIFIILAPIMINLIIKNIRYAKANKKNIDSKDKKNKKEE